MLEILILFVVSLAGSERNARPRWQTGRHGSRGGVRPGWSEGRTRGGRTNGKAMKLIDNLHGFVRHIMWGDDSGHNLLGMKYFEGHRRCEKYQESTGM